MSALLAIDPGLDCTGWALYDLTGVVRPLWLNDAGKRLQLVGRWVTRASDPDDHRMSELARAFTADAHAHGVTTVAIEAPPRPGLYARHDKWGPRAMAQGVAYANALPALYLGAATALGLTAFYVPASTTPKAKRWAQYSPFVSLETLPRRTNEDERDAVIVGLAALSDHRRRWVA